VTDNVVAIVTVDASLSHFVCCEDGEEMFSCLKGTTE